MMNKVVVRQSDTFPKQLSRFECVHTLSLDHRVAEIQQAEAKRQSVRDGLTRFGIPVVLPSFQLSNPKYQLELTIQNVFIMNMLVQPDVMRTSMGQVCVFPLTIYKTEMDRQAQKNGEPVIAFHRAQFKWSMFRRYSSTYNRIVLPDFDTHLGHVKCEFKTKDDHALLEVTGLERYKNETHNLTNAFFLIPATWFDMMIRPFLQFTRSDFGGQIVEAIQPKDIMECLRMAFADLPFKDNQTYASLLQDIYSVKWTGCAKSVQVLDVLALPEDRSSHPMTRCGPMKGKLNFDGTVWDFKRRGKEIAYTEHCLAYGVKCWQEQLVALNSAYEYFTGRRLSKVYHMEGLFQVVDHPEPESKEKCMAEGIQGTKRRRNVDLPTRRKRYELNKRRKTEAPFFGENCLREYHAPILHS